MAKAKYITSVINHNIRVLLGLTCCEYAAMDILHELYCEQPITADVRLQNRLGFTKDESTSILESLSKKKMIYLNADFIPVYLIDKRWLEQHSVDHDFLEFWQIFRKHGNEPTACKAYRKARKYADKETLHEAAKNYIAYCDQHNSDPKFNLKAQSWLDTEKQRWNDRLGGEKGEAASERKHAFL